MDPHLIKKVRRRDRIARWIITFGGILIVISVLGIMLLIAEVALPLFAPPNATLHGSYTAPELTAGVLAVGLDRYLETGFTLTADGVFTFFDAQSGALLRKVELEKPAPGATVRQASVEARQRYTLLWSDETVTLEQLSFAPRFDSRGERTIESALKRLAVFEAEAGASPTRIAMARQLEEEGSVLLRHAHDGYLTISQRIVTTNFLDEREVETHAVRIENPFSVPLTAVALDSTGEFLYAGTAKGHLLRWDLREAGEAELLEQFQAFEDGRAVTALSLVLGDISLAVGDAKGGIATWFPVAGAGNVKRLRRIHELKSHPSGISRILATANSKSLLSVDREGGLHFDYTTNERHLLGLRPPQRPVAVGINTRSNGLAAIDVAGRVTVWALDVPHPEASLGAYFGKVWYEGFSQPEYSWQSSAANEDFEPKLSLIPLIFGTIKGTLYGMLFAAPLAIFAALYSSHLMNPRLHRIVKPTFEIMGAIPTVVIGFIAALWFAPLVRVTLGAFILMIVVLPAVVLASAAMCERIRAFEAARKLIQGYEFVLLFPLLVVGVYIAFQGGEFLEYALFDGDLPQWLFQHLDLQFDQRNSIIIAFALGFAVIPTVYTISDDALANVPRNLTAASLALGATRWQTVWRIVLPSASPGVFAALMIGFGRVVGETMIVLMATGNTPITEWSILNGMRTLSANIAVEIPEAPFEGTLYRTLFFSAVLLFMTTFVLNSAAEMVRMRLKKKFGQS